MRYVCVIYGSLKGFRYNKAWSSADYVYLSCHIRVLSEFVLWNCLKVKKLFSRNKHGIWDKSDHNEIQIYYQVLCKPTLNNLAKLANVVKWLSIFLQNKSLWVRILLQLWFSAIKIKGLCVCKEPLSLALVISKV